MWQATVLTLFPDMFPGPLGASLAGKALANGIWRLVPIDIRDFAADKHRTVDDTPAGGGPGMVMKADVLAHALDAVSLDGRPRLLMSPRGRPLTQSRVEALTREAGVVLVCGRFEGIDQRVIEGRGLEEVSVGDYVLSGGEIGAMALLDACVRLLPGVMGAEASGAEETFSAGLLEYPQYTRPNRWEDRLIPEVLTSGDHAKVKAWRHAEAERLTRERRPDLWAAYLKGMQTVPEQADTCAIVMVDHRGVIQSWNTGAEALFGHPAASAVGQTLDLIVPEKYRERHWAGFHAAIETGTAKSENAASAVPALRRDGSVVKFPVRFMLLRDPLGQAIGAVATFAKAASRGA